MSMYSNGALRIDAVLRGTDETFAIEKYLVRDQILSAGTFRLRPICVHREPETILRSLR
jgi:hypothetical protein